MRKFKLLSNNLFNKQNIILILIVVVCLSCSTNKKVTSNIPFGVYYSSKLSLKDRFMYTKKYNLTKIINLKQVLILLKDSTFYHANCNYSIDLSGNWKQEKDSLVLYNLYDFERKILNDSFRYKFCVTNEGMILRNYIIYSNKKPFTCVYSLKPNPDYDFNLVDTTQIVKDSTFLSLRK